MNFSRSDVAKVMNQADITEEWWPTDPEAQEVMRAAIACGVLYGAKEFHVTQDGDFFVILEGDGFRCTATALTSTRYLWKSGLRGSAAVRDMLDTVADQIKGAGDEKIPGLPENE